MDQVVPIELHEPVSQLMAETRAFLNSLDVIPRATSSADAILLALLSKSIVVTDAVAHLVCHRHQDEAFGLGRTSIEIQLTIRYLTNSNTANRCDRFCGYFAKDTTEWGKLYQKYYPNSVLKQRSDATEIEKAATSYQSPHRWAEKGITLRDFASEADSFERAPDGSPLDETFSYEIPYKWMSHYVHATVRSIQPAHATLPGDQFRVHPGRVSERSQAMGEMALMFAFQAVQLNLSRVMRFFNMTFPDDLETQYAALVTLFKSQPD